MFIGHFAVGLAAKKAAPGVSLGTLFFAVQFLDLLWPTLLLLNLEQVEITTDPAAPIPLRFVHYPISHSLLAAAGWGVAIGLVYWLARKDQRAAIIVGLCVLSHWILDLIVHIPDLPLYPGDSSPLLGLGLWHSKLGTLVLETLLFAGGIYLYLGAARPRSNAAKYSFWALIVFLYGIYLTNIFGPPPPGVEAIAWAGQLQWLFVVWAWWVDRQ
jgi:hypothetical protein